jgi:hypothetical protein
VEIAVQRAAAFDLVVAASATVMESLMAIAGYVQSDIVFHCSPP